MFTSWLQINVVFVSSIGCLESPENVWPEHLRQMCSYIFMFEETQHLQFPKDPFARNKILEDIGHLFESHSLSISGIRHRP